MKAIPSEKPMCNKRLSCLKFLPALLSPIRGGKKVLGKGYSTVVTALLLFALCACGGQKPNVASYKRITPPLLPKYVTVTKGDNIYALSQKYKVSVQELAQLNAIQSPYFLAVGRRIYLPQPDRYLVRKGDTLYDIAQKFNVSLSTMARVNALSTRTKIQAGSYLIVPKNARARPTNVDKSAEQKAAIKRQKATGQKTPLRQNTPLTNIYTTKIPKRLGRFIMPVKGKILASKSGVHTNSDSIRIATSKGALVVASENGLVAYAGKNLSSLGNIILIQHANNFITVYGYLSKIFVKKGMAVKQGQKIGRVGFAGRMSRPQLYFQLRKGNKVLNPNIYLR